MVLMITISFSMTGKIKLWKSYFTKHAHFQSSFVISPSLFSFGWKSPKTREKWQSVTLDKIGRRRWCERSIFQHHRAYIVNQLLIQMLPGVASAFYGRAFIRSAREHKGDDFCVVCSIFASAFVRTSPTLAEFYVLFYCVCEKRVWRRREPLGSLVRWAKCKRRPCGVLRLNTSKAATRWRGSRNCFAALLRAFQLWTGFDFTLNGLFKLAKSLS